MTETGRLPPNRWRSHSAENDTAARRSSGSDIRWRRSGRPPRYLGDTNAVRFTRLLARPEDSPHRTSLAFSQHLLDITWVDLQRYRSPGSPNIAAGTRHHRNSGR